MPIEVKICFTLLIDPPEISVPKHSKYFPAADLIPGILGWLCQQNSRPHTPQKVFKTTIVPEHEASTNGPSALQR